MWGLIAGLAQGAGSIVGDLLKARSQRKNDLQVTRLKIKHGEALTEQDVQILRTKGMAESIKDEVALCVVFLPWLAMFFSAWFPSFGTAAENMISLVSDPGSAYTWLLTASVAASLGLRMKRR